MPLYSNTPTKGKMSSTDIQKSLDKYLVGDSCKLRKEILLYIIEGDGKRFNIDEIHRHLIKDNDFRKLTIEQLSPRVGKLKAKYPFIGTELDTRPGISREYFYKERDILTKSELLDYISGKCPD